MKYEISTRSAPAAIGPYSQAIGDGEWLFCSGQIGIDPASGKLVEGGVEAETRCVMENLREVLGAADLLFKVCSCLSNASKSINQLFSSLNSYSTHLPPESFTALV